MVWTAAEAVIVIVASFLFVICLFFSLLFSPELLSFVLAWKLQVFFFSPWQASDIMAQKKSLSHPNFRRHSFAGQFLNDLTRRAKGAGKGTCCCFEAGRSSEVSHLSAFSVLLERAGEWSICKHQRPKYPRVHPTIALASLLRPWAKLSNGKGLFFAIELKCQTISSSRRNSDRQTLCSGVGFALLWLRNWRQHSLSYHHEETLRVGQIDVCGSYTKIKKKGDICELGLAEW